MSESARPAHEPTLIASGLAAVEGPTAAPDGWILNVCSMTRPTENWPTRGGDITATAITEARTTYRVFNTSTAEVTGIPAALAFGPDGALYVTDEGRRAIVRADPAGEQRDFVTTVEGNRLNGPNDLSFDPTGNLYFTDPWTSSPANPIGGVCVYMWETGEVRLLDTGMAFPNGIVVRDDRLYVAETYPRIIWVYEIPEPGVVKSKREFCTLPDPGRESIAGPDGVAFDSVGQLYVAHYGGSGVYVFDTSGKQIAVIETPGVNPTNVCFGGPGHSQLFVTIDDPGTLVAFALGVRGDRINFCPTDASSHPWAPVLAGLGEDDLIGT
jgi:gluconolactonase